MDIQRSRGRTGQESSIDSGRFARQLHHIKDRRPIRWGWTVNLRHQQ